MIQASTLQYLKDLKKNNNKPWFDSNRKNYDAAKEDLLAFTDKLIPALAEYDSNLAHLKAKDCMFRINRDVRFSKNKLPYKNNMAVAISRNGKKAMEAGFYLHLEPGNSFIAGGYWMPEAKDLAKIRQEIDYNLDDWKKIISNKKFKTSFPEGLEKENSLVRPPKGYDDTNPAIEFLKMKSFVVSSPITDEDLKSKDALKKTVAVFVAMKPLLDFLTEAVAQ